MTFDTLTSPALLGLGCLYAFLALASPKAALFVLLPTIALAPETQIGLVVIRPDDLMLSILAISWGLRRMVSIARRSTPLDQPLVAYFAIGLAATLWGAAIGTADLTSLAKFSASGLHLLKRLEFILYFLILRDSIRSITDAQWLIYMFMASLAGLTVYSFGRYQETGTIALGPGGTPIHEPALASMLNVAFALGFLVTPGGMGRSGIALVVLLGSLYTLPFGLGRNYLVSTLLLLVIVAVWRKRPGLLFLPLAVAMISLAGATLFPTNVTERFRTLESVFDPRGSALGVSLADRFGPGLDYTWQVLTSSPLLGWGLGSVALGSIDNEYAGQFTYTGLLGFAAFVWLARRIVQIARETHRAAQAQMSPALPLTTGLQHALLGYALYSIFSPSISAARAGAFFFTILGLVAVLHREVVVNAGSPEAIPASGAVEFLPRSPASGAVGWSV